MKSYRLRHTTDKKVIGKFPQFETGYFPVHSSDRRLMLNIFFTEVNEQEVFAPVPKLVKGARLADFSQGTATGSIISDRLRSLIETTMPVGLQFIPQKIIVENDEQEGFWLTNNFQFDYDVIDFPQTDISIMRDTWEVGEVVRVNNKEQFLQLVESTKLPQSIRIFKPVFKVDYPKDFFALRYVYHGFSFFCSEHFREKLEAEKVSGIRFMELDEQL
jgi:hypothetical protein